MQSTSASHRLASGDFLWQLLGLISNQISFLKRLLLPLHLRPTERVEAVRLAKCHLSPRPQRRKRRRSESDRVGEREILIEGNADEQKSAEEKLKERLKAKFGDTHAREEGESSSKRPKITWP